MKKVLPPCANLAQSLFSCTSNPPNMLHSALKALAAAAAIVACAALALASVFLILETIRPDPAPPMVLGSPEFIEFMTAR